MKTWLNALFAVAVLVIAGGMVCSAQHRVVTLTVGHPSSSWFISASGDDTSYFRYTESGEYGRKKWQREGSLFSLKLPVGKTYEINTIEDKDGNLGADFTIRMIEKGQYALVFPGGEESRWDGECRRRVVKDKKAMAKLRRQLARVRHMEREEIVALAAELASAESESAGDTVPVDSEVLVLFQPLPADASQLGILPFLYVSVL